MSPDHHIVSSKRCVALIETMCNFIQSDTSYHPKQHVFSIEKTYPFIRKIYNR